MLKKLRLKFIGINMLIFAIMLCMVFALVFRSTRDNLEHESLQMMRNIAEDPFRLGRPDEKYDEVRLPYFVLQISLTGEILASGGGYFDLSDQVFLRSVTIAALKSGAETGELKDYDLRFLRQDSIMSVCLVFADQSSEQAVLTDLIKTLAAIGFLGLLVFLGISILLAFWTVKPVSRAWTQQRQFVADASHELKTPLTVIMTNAELLNDPEASETDRAQFSQNILAMSHNMRGLVDGLLELARADNGTSKMAFAPVDWSLLVSDTVLPFEPVYYERGLNLHCIIQPDLHVQGSEPHLRQVVEILLDNAMKYTAPHTTVVVHLRSQNGRCILTVSNPGDPISKDDLKNIFKRFYRTDPARTGGSYGLGLSIAESIVELHDGKIWAESLRGHNLFHVQLPVYGK